LILLGRFSFEMGIAFLVFLVLELQEVAGKERRIVNQQC
jgi:hypothetical protein